MRGARSVLGLALVLVFFGGCSEEPAPRPAKKSEKKTDAPIAAPVAETTTEDVAYHYDPTGKRDPFRSFIQDRVSEDGQTPLERFDLTQLELTAIVWGVDAPRAVIKDPAGRGYIVREGTKVGKNKGRIVAISDNLVKVKETYVNGLGQATTKAVEIRLREGTGG